MGAGYTPIRLFHVSMIWAIWKQWCTFMYEENYDPNSDWTTSVLKLFKKELIRRLYESMSVIQWLKVADKNRRVDGERTVPEKEFLLIWANTVNTNPIAIDAPNGEIDPIMMAWLGKEEIISIDRLYHRPRLRFNHSKYASYAFPQLDGAPPSPPQAPGLDPHRPAYAAG